MKKITRMRFLSAMRSKFAALAYDLACIPVAWYLAYWLRFNLGAIPEPYLYGSILPLGLTAIVQCGAYFAFGLYRGVWRFSSLHDMLLILKAVGTSCLITLPCLFLSNQLDLIPRSLLPLYALNLTALLAGGRLVLRQWATQQHKSGGIRTLIVGAGQAGEGLVRDLVRDVTQAYLPVGFVDDRMDKAHTCIHGIKVLGRCRDIPDIIARHNIKLIFIAVPSARSASMRRIVNYCNKARVAFQTLPSIADLATGKVNINALREVSLDDLLGRDEVELDWAGIKKTISSQRVLVTGGGGSIGSELCRQVAALNPQSLVIVEQCEFNCYQIELELRDKFPGLNLQVYLNSVTDKQAIDTIFNTEKPQLVFHAAAYKHVPLLESQVRVAVYNNIFGTQYCADAAVKYQVEKFILISTDKAVNPANVMGSTKRVAEMICQQQNTQGQTQFVTVRFGNVLGSAGSVIPLFKQQLALGGPLTVTHPDITRFFMTIPEACRLILQAELLGKGGEIFVLDMGEPVKISYLAEELIRLAGKTPGEDIDIVYTGLRPGEKLFEELFYQYENLNPTNFEKILKANACCLPKAKLASLLQALQQGYEQAKERQLRETLSEAMQAYEATENA